jgi:SAM-dependent methyltransferase
MSACRGCGQALDPRHVFCDLGAQPLANRLLTDDRLAEARYPLRALHCPHCSLVQLSESISPQEIFTAEYPYFSSQSPAFVRHAARYAQHAIERFSLGPESLVVEVASNDGYLLRHFVKAGIRCYGVEPCRGVAEHAIRSGVPTLIDFFDAALVCERLIDSDPETKLITGGRADLIAANNVLAHVPEIDGFLHGLSLLLAPEGVLSIEVPWLKDLVDALELGTIYHEHCSYFLLCTLQHMLGLGATGLRIFDVEPLPEIHGGSLRIYACHPDAGHAEQPIVGKLLAQERDWLAGSPLERFAGRAADLKRGVWRFLLEQHRLGHQVAGYCAAAKASTLLSWAGIGPEDLPYIADTTPAKQGRYLPGARIPIVHPERLQAEQPDVIWILAPNWAEEIVPKLRASCPWRPAIAWQDGERIRFAPSAEPIVRAA